MPFQETPSRGKRVECDAPGLEHPPQFGQGPAVVLDMLEHFVTHDDVEAPILERDSVGIRLDDSEDIPRGAGLRKALREGIVQIHAVRLVPGLPEVHDQVAGPAAEIQDLHFR